MAEVTIVASNGSARVTVCGKSVDVTPLHPRAFKLDEGKPLTVEAVTVRPPPETEEPDDNV